MLAIKLLAVGLSLLSSVTTAFDPRGLRKRNDVNYIDAGDYLNVFAASPKNRRNVVVRSPTGNPNQVAEVCQRILEYGLDEFCASYVHEPLYPHTTTEYYKTRTASVNAFLTVSTTVTTIVPSGTLDVTATITDTLTVTYTAETDTIFATTTVLSIFTTSIPTVTTVTTYSAPDPLKAKRDALPAITVTSYTSTVTSTLFPAPPKFKAKRDAVLDQRHSSPPPPAPLPGPLQGIVPSLISSACSSILATRTTTVYAIETISVTNTHTSVKTVVDVEVTPATTDTITLTSLATESVPVTLVTTDVATLISVTTSTVYAVSTATVCPYQTNVDGGGVDTSGTLTPYTNIQTDMGCCAFCFSTTGCDLWFFFPGFGCFLVADASGPDANAQCPTGYGEAVVILASGYDGNIGGPGPCGTSFAD